MDNFDSMDRAPENALEWASDKLKGAEYAIIIIGDSEGWQRGLFGVESLSQFLGIMEDVKLTEWISRETEDS